MITRNLLMMISLNDQFEVDAALDPQTSETPSVRWLKPNQG